MSTSCELHSLFILNPDDYERGRMSPYGTQSFGTRDVWYINYSDTLMGVFLFVDFFKNATFYNRLIYFSTLYFVAFYLR